MAGAFKEAVSAMKGTAPGMSREERILANIACHSAVKLGDKLSYEEMKALIKEWLTSRYPATCPHGRSICYRLDHKDIARKLDNANPLERTARRSPRHLSSQTRSIGFQTVFYTGT